MSFDATYVLRFVNRARAAMGLDGLTELPFAGAVRADERACVLGRALGYEVGGSDDSAWDGQFVMRLPDRELAEAVAAATGQAFNSLGEVLLPDAITNLAVGFDHAWINASDARYLPQGQMCFEDLQ